MKIALSTFNIQKNSVSQNVEKLVRNVVKITNLAIVDMVMFPEDCFTGLNITDNPDHDIHLGRCINGDEVNHIKKIAKGLA